MRRAKKKIHLPANEAGWAPPRPGKLKSRATSDHSQKSLTVTHRKPKRVIRLSRAEKQRRWRKRHRAAHKAQQDYRRRKSHAQQEADVLNATVREDQELQERLAARDGSIRAHSARREAFRLAKAAGLEMTAWFKLPEAEKWADMKDKLIAEEREEQELQLLEKERGWDRFGNPLNGRCKPEPTREPTESEAWAMRRKAAYNAQLNILSNGMILN